MKSNPLNELGFAIRAEAEEPVVALVERVFGAPPAVYFNSETGETRVSVYTEASDAALGEQQRELAAGLAMLRAAGVDPGAGDESMAVRAVRREDWAESWKKHFKPLAIGGALLIRPSWSQRRARAGAAEVVLDPGLSFGTGQHATTSFCLRQLVKHRPRDDAHFNPAPASSLASRGTSGERAGERGNSDLRRPSSPLPSPPAAGGEGDESVEPRAVLRHGEQSGGAGRAFLDIGTGSGILAISAAKLGYAPVEAFDFDPESVRVARDNARQNGVANAVKISQRDLTQVPRASRTRYDVVCANLIFDLLIAERERVVNRLKPDGVLVLAGILATQFPRVVEAYTQVGMQLVATKVEKEWQSGSFVRAR